MSSFRGSVRRPTTPDDDGGPVREDLARRGRDLLLRFCAANGVEPPRLGGPVPRRNSTGLYYRDVVYVTHGACARPGYGGRAWSWPGYVVDRTPYGVYQHELGHHFDALLGYPARAARAATGEPPITGYAPNAAEWWAECFRLFVTNPDLLRLVRPATYRYLTAVKRLMPAETRPWREVLDGAPARYFAAAVDKGAV